MWTFGGFSFLTSQSAQHQFLSSEAINIFVCKQDFYHIFLDEKSYELLRVFYIQKKQQVEAIFDKKKKMLYIYIVMYTWFSNLLSIKAFSMDGT